MSDDTIIDEVEVPRVEAETADQGEAAITEENPVDVISDDAEDGEDQEVVFGDEAPKEEPESSTMRHMRKLNRETQKELREARKQLEELKKPVAIKQLRAEPTLEDHLYDEPSYKADLKKFYQEELEFKNEQLNAEKKQQEVQQEFQGKIKAFNDSFTALSFKDKDDALQEVMANLDGNQQGVLLDAVDNPAMIVYALGKNPSKLADLSKEKNLVRLGSKLAKMETQLKVISRKPKTKPDTPIQGTGGLGGVMDKTHAKLQEEARRTKNYTKLFAYEKTIKK